MRYSHWNEWRMIYSVPFRFVSPVSFHFCTMIRQLVSIRCICHMPHSILQLNYVIVVAFALPFVGAVAWHWTILLCYLIPGYFPHIFSDGQHLDELTNKPWNFTILMVVWGMYNSKPLLMFTDKYSRVCGCLIYESITIFINDYLVIRAS